MRNQVHLIAYADRLAGGLAGLHELLQGPLRGAFGGVHVLPFFDPVDGADAGFDPIDHTSVDRRLGTWADVEALAALGDVMADAIVNHVSAASPAFLDVRRHGEASSQAGRFLTYERVFPEGASEADLLAVYRPRPGLPFTPVHRGDGSTRLYWTTFGAGQIDLDTASPDARAYLEEVLAVLARHGVRTVRLDAVGYTVKRAGTSCFMLPETLAFVDWLTERAHRLGLETLVEVHSSYRSQLLLARRADWVYDFALSPLVLHGLHTGDADPLDRWLRMRPLNAVTVLDTHDGIGVVDVGADAASGSSDGLLDRGQLESLVESIHTHSGGASRAATPSPAAGLDLYQVNTTYLDALGGDEDRYLLARLLQLFVPGVPQVYYVGLLGGRNDLDLFGATKVGRDVNRRWYVPAEVDEALERPLVRAQLAACRLRNRHPAFQGRFRWLRPAPGRLALRWVHGIDTAELTVALDEGWFVLEHSEGGRRVVADSLASLAAAPG